jgi:hypothetical protein
MTGAEMLRKWLTGMGYTEGLREFVQSFSDARYDGTIYRGMFFDHYPSKEEIYACEFCSWTTSRDVANYFASHTRYGFMLTKRSTGYDVQKILSILDERGELPDNLKTYRRDASEHEVLDMLDPKAVRVQRVGV